jgi:lyso-ornithine lipid O-acyltransferase
MLSSLRAFLKLPIFVLFIVGLISFSLVGQVLWRDPVRRRLFFARNTGRFSRLGLWLLGARVRAVHPPDSDKNYLLVSNHLGMVDILVIASLHPTLFITSVEMREAPLLGLLTEMGGCLYVERRSRTKIAGEILDIRKALTQGVSVVLFPEGTSTNGEQVLPFKKSLLVTVAGTGIPIKPLTINFRKVNGQPMSHEFRDYVFWYGDQSFAPAMWRLLSVKSIDIEVDFLDEIEVHSEDQRREVAARAHAMIAAKFSPVAVPAAEPSGIMEPT